MREDCLDRSDARLPDGPISFSESLVSLGGVVLIAYRDSLRAVVLVHEDGDEDALSTGPLPNCRGVALNLWPRAQVIDVRDLEVLKMGDALIGDAGWISGAEDDAGPDGVARSGGDGDRMTSEVPEVGEAGDVVEWGAEIGHGWDGLMDKRKLDDM